MARNVLGHFQLLCLYYDSLITIYRLVDYHIGFLLTITTTYFVPL